MSTNQSNPKWEIIPQKTALLVIDMQNDFVEKGAIMEVPKAKTQVPKIKELIKVCRNNGIPVTYTTHHTDPKLCALEIYAFPHLISAGMRSGTRGVEVVDELAPNPNEYIIKKHRFSAFYNTELETVLRGLKGSKEGSDAIDTLIICGTVTNICCESTARDAFYRDYKVVFGSDICSALSDEIHNATLANMEIFGRVMGLEEILKSISL